MTNTTIDTATTIGWIRASIGSNRKNGNSPRKSIIEEKDVDRLLAIYFHLSMNHLKKYLKSY